MLTIAATIYINIVANKELEIDDNPERTLWSGK